MFKETLVHFYVDKRVSEISTYLLTLEHSLKQLKHVCKIKIYCFFHVHNVLAIGRKGVSEYGDRYPTKSIIIVIENEL